MTNTKQIKNIFVMSALLLSVVGMTSNQAFAATSPDLGAANSFGILANTYTNSGAGTSISGDLGYTVAPANPPTVLGTTFISTDAPYIAAQVAQSNAIVFLNNPVLSGNCDVSFAGATDLSLVNGGVYSSGVYCIDGAATIGATGITLDGNGIHIFRINGALDTVATSVISMTKNAEACDVFWVPVGATTLADQSTFVGTILSDAAFTLGANVDMTGRILSNGAVTTTGPSDTITVPSCDGNGNQHDDKDRKDKHDKKDKHK